MDPAAEPALTDDDLHRLQDLLAALPDPLQPLEPSALDGYLCGILLQPQRLPLARWLARVIDIDGTEPPPGLDMGELQALVRRRHAELDRAIGERQWFDPWIYATDEAATPSEAVQPWVAGFSLALEHHPALMELPDAELVEPLALLLMHIDPADLEDADALLAVIETLEPPADLAEAVQDLVRALMLIADVTRPCAAATSTRAAPPRKTRPRSPTRRTRR